MPTILSSLINIYPRKLLHSATQMLTDMWYWDSHNKNVPQQVAAPGFHIMLGYPLRHVQVNHEIFGLLVCLDWVEGVILYVHIFKCGVDGNLDVFLENTYDLCSLTGLKFSFSSVRKWQSWWRKCFWHSLWCFSWIYLNSVCSVDRMGGENNRNEGAYWGRDRKE